jgi:hypothetical protein
MTYFRTKINMPNSDGSLILAITPKVIEDFRSKFNHVIYILQNKLSQK